MPICGAPHGFAPSPISSAMVSPQSETCSRGKETERSKRPQKRDATAVASKEPPARFVNETLLCAKLPFAEKSGLPRYALVLRSANSAWGVKRSEWDHSFNAIGCDET